MKEANNIFKVIFDSKQFVIFRLICKHLYLYILIPSLGQSSKAINYGGRVGSACWLGSVFSVLVFVVAVLGFVVFALGVGLISRAVALKAFWADFGKMESMQIIIKSEN